MCAYYVEMMCVGKIGVGWAHDVFSFACHMFMHFSYIHTIFFLYLIDINYVGTFLFIPLSLSLFLSLSFFQLVALWHLNGNLLCIGTLFVPGHLLFPPLLILHPPMSSSMMIKLVSTFRRTFHDTTFIWNAKSFYRIFPILTFPLSSIVGVESHCVASQSLVRLWS